MVEGIGYDFIPTVFDRSVVDKWYKCDDKENFTFSRRLIREEGLLCGGSSGAAVAAAVKAARSLKAGQKCVVILPDSIRNYITKFVDDKWLRVNDLLDPEGPLPDWWAKPLSVMGPLRSASLKIETTCSEAVQKMKKEGVTLLPVVDEKNAVVGVVTSTDITFALCSNSAQSSSAIASLMKKTYSKLELTTPPATLGKLSQHLNKDQYAVVVKTSEVECVKKLLLQGLITSVDFSNFICSL